MKIIIALLAVVGVLAAEQDIYKLPKDTTARMRKIARMCADEHGMEYTMIPKIIDGTLPRNENSNKFLYCFTLTSGYIIQDGHMVVETIADLAKDHPRIEEFKDALRKCNEVSKEDHLSTVVYMNSCFAASPIRFVLQ